jgi:hypothetical protein
MKMKMHLKTVGVSCAVVWLAMAEVQAQIIPVLTVGNTIPATDVLGRNLPGTKDEPDTASRVEIREVGDAIFPPDPETGEGNETKNPLFLVSYLGWLVVGTNTGMFCETLTNRLPAGKTYFARVYDAPSVSNAIYYANSTTFVDVPGSNDIHVVFHAVQRVDGQADTDADGDLIPEWMELDLGTDPNDWDTDDDGYNDGFEVVHGDYLNPKLEDPREIRIRAPEYVGAGLTGEHAAIWWTIPGVAYRLEFRPRWADGEAYSNIWSGTASETNLEVNVETWVQTNSPAKGFFRWIMP